MLGQSGKMFALVCKLKVFVAAWCDGLQAVLLASKLAGKFIGSFI
jgi:hypothetical protein